MEPFSKLKEWIEPILPKSFLQIFQPRNGWIIDPVPEYSSGGLILRNSSGIGTYLPSSLLKASDLTVQKKYDVFLSFPEEDRDIALEFYNALSKRGIQTWCSKKNLKIGSSIIETVNNAISNSDSAVIIITKNTLSDTRHFPILELTALINQYMYHNFKNLFIVYHEINHRAILQKMPLLADYFAYDTGEGVEYVADSIAHIIQPE